MYNCLITVLVAFLLAPICSEDWPVWRGVDGDGISKETGILKSWPQKGIKEVWRSSLGTGYSGISISNGIAYTCYGEYNDEYCIAIAVKSGEPIWVKHIGPLFPRKRAPGPRATPIVDSDKVYVVGGLGNFWCLQAKTGKVVWRLNLSKKFAAPKLKWGVCSSPILYKNTLLYNAGGPDGHSLVALHKESGEVVWACANDRPAYSTPGIVKICGETQAVFFTDKGIVAVTPDKGHILWRYGWKSSNIATTPICYEDHVFISSAYGAGSALVKISKEEEKYQVQEIWRSKKPQNHYSCSILYKGYIYGFHKAIFVCVDFKTGKQMWSQRGFQKGMLIGIDGHAVVLGQRGNLALVELSAEKYIEKGHFKPFDATNCLTVPTIADGKLFIRDDKEMICLDLTKENRR